MPLDLHQRKVAPRIGGNQLRAYRGLDVAADLQRFTLLSDMLLGEDVAVLRYYDAGAAGIAVPYGSCVKGRDGLAQPRRGQFLAGHVDGSSELVLRIHRGQHGVYTSPAWLSLAMSRRSSTHHAMIVGAARRVTQSLSWFTSVLRNGAPLVAAGPARGVKYSWRTSICCIPASIVELAMSISACTPLGAGNMSQSAAVAWTVGTQITKHGYIPQRVIGSSQDSRR